MAGLNHHYPAQLGAALCRSRKPEVFAFCHYTLSPVPAKSGSIQPAPQIQVVFRLPFAMMVIPFQRTGVFNMATISGINTVAARARRQPPAAPVVCGLALTAGGGGGVTLIA
jgi:hypothetical protein